MRWEEASSKWSRVEGFLLAAMRDPIIRPPGTWWITFSSMSGGAMTYTFADKINPQLQSWLESQRTSTERLGTVVMDFPKPREIDLLIARNLQYADVTGGTRELVDYHVQLASQDAYLGDAYLGSNRWNYAQVHAGQPTGGPYHTLHKVRSSHTSPGTTIHEGDVVLLQSTQFTNDSYVYLAANGDGVNCIYDRVDGDGPHYGSTDVEWIVERKPGTSAPTTEILEGEPVRLRNVHVTLNLPHFSNVPCYLAAQTDGYLCVQSTLHGHYDAAKAYPSPFDWVFVR
jgi:hypothetical protein